MDLKLFGKKISLSLAISLVTLAIVLSTTYSCCHTHNIIEGMTGKGKKGKKINKKESFAKLKEGHDTINNSQRGPPGNPTIVNVATQPTQQPKSSPPISLNITNNLKDKKKNGSGSTTTEQASATDASTSGDMSTASDATSTTDTTATTEGFSNLDDNTGSDWINSASGYATNMGTVDTTSSSNYTAKNWTPDHTMTMFSNNTKKASCCATSSYSTSTGCPCITNDQFKYLSSRGGNHSNGDI